MHETTDRIGRVIAAVLAQALDDTRTSTIVLLADGSPEAALTERLLRPHLGERLGAVAAASAASADLLGAWARAVTEFPNGLVALARNKTDALLGGALPAPLLPIGDLWASQVAALTGDWSAAAPVRELAVAAGGIDLLDHALQALVDRRLDPATALAALPEQVGGTLLALWEDARFARRRLGLVPRLGTRTIGVDLFD